MKITSVEVKVLEKRQRLCGSAAIVLDDCFKVRDILILEKESTGELHISMPSKKLGKNYFVALVHPITSEFRHEMLVLKNGIVKLHSADTVVLGKDDQNGKSRKETPIEGGQAVEGPVSA